MNKKQLEAYSIFEIASWIEKNSNIKLPSLQRGFVWKSYQIEALWDSIFRGYPIGSILMSKSNNEKFLLDGQQRCTSIALGLNNPLENNDFEVFSLKNYLPSVWIDLKPNKITQNQNYLFRVLTKSHPWGYQIENRKSLSMSDRRDALEFFKKKQNIDQYIDLSPVNINPWDASYPVPLSFVLKFKKDELKGKLKELNVKTKYFERVNYEELIEEDFDNIYNGVLNAKELIVPEIQVKDEILKEDDESFVSESQDPTLFVRLNSAGTPISGEELIYSIFKAAFPENKELVEEVGASFIAPSKIINIFSRTSYCVLNDYNNYPTAFNINSFRKTIKDEKYRKILSSFIEESKAKTLITAAKDILENKNGSKLPSVPTILLKQMISSNIDLFFILIAYINKYPKRLNNVAPHYVHILWLQRDKNRLHKELFSLLFNQDKSWEEACVELVKKELLVPLLRPELLELQLNIVFENKINFDNPEFKLENAVIDCLQISEDYPFKEYWKEFIHKLRGNRSLLLFAQRKYMNLNFEEFNQIENIEDTNRPWDWDHIYPISWVYYKPNIHYLVKNWVNSIGNLRALSYDDNRSENNYKSPKERFESDINKNDSFVN